MQQSCCGTAEALCCRKFYKLHGAASQRNLHSPPAFQQLPTLTATSSPHPHADPVQRAGSQGCQATSLGPQCVRVAHSHLEVREGVQVVDCVVRRERAPRRAPAGQPHRDRDRVRIGSIHGVQVLRTWSVIPLSCCVERQRTLRRRVGNTVIYGSRWCTNLNRSRALQYSLILSSHMTYKCRLQLRGKLRSFAPC